MDAHVCVWVVLIDSLSQTLAWCCRTHDLESLRMEVEDSLLQVTSQSESVLAEFLESIAIRSSQSCSNWLQR